MEGMLTAEIQGCAHWNMKSRGQTNVCACVCVKGVAHEQTDGRTDGRTDGKTGRRTDGRTEAAVLSRVSQGFSQVRNKFFLVGSEIFVSIRFRTCEKP